MANELVRVLLVENHAIVREGLRLILAREPDITVVGDVGSATEALALFLRLCDAPGIDVIVTDISLPDFDGIEMTRRAKAYRPDVRVLGVSIFSDPEHVVGLLGAGADGYLSKDAAAADLPAAIRACASGQGYLWPGIAGRLLAHLRQQREREQQPERLTASERAVLRLTATGLSSKEIGRELGLSAKTVENYRSRILGKLGVANSAEAVALAFREGLLEQSADGG